MKENDIGKKDGNLEINTERDKIKDEKTNKRKNVV